MGLSTNGGLPSRMATFDLYGDGSLLLLPESAVPSVVGGFLPKGRSSRTRLIADDSLSRVPCSQRHVGGNLS